MATRTIDLGIIDNHSSEVDTAGGRAGHRLRLSWPATLAALLMVLTTTGSSPPSPGRITPMVSVPAGQQAILTDQYVYVVASVRDHPDPAATTLSAYRLDDGQRRWQVTYVGPVSVETIRGVPLISGWGTGQAGTTALDPDTGAVRWHHDGYAIGSWHDTVLLGGFHTSGHRVADTAHAITAVNLDTGQRQWTQGTDELYSHVNGRYLATLSRDGDLRSYDLATGEQLARVTVQELPTAAAVQVVGSQLLVREARWRASAVVAYDAATLTRQWRTTVPSGADPWACGQVICLLHNERLHALDRTTGQPAWPPVAAAPFPHAPVVTHLDGGERVLFTSSTTRTPSWSVQTSSGQTDAPLSQWVRPQPRTIEVNSAEAYSPVLLHADPVSTATWVARLDAHSGTLDVLGKVPDTLTPLCTAAGQLLACRTMDQERAITVWRLR